MCECLKEGVVRTGRYAYKCASCVADSSFAVVNAALADPHIVDELIRKGLDKKEGATV